MRKLVVGGGALVAAGVAIALVCDRDFSIPIEAWIGDDGRPARIAVTWSPSPSPPTSSSSASG